MFFFVLYIFEILSSSLPKRTDWILSSTFTFFDNSSDRVSQKIKRASLKKIPLHIILGEEERDNKELSVRTLSGENSKMTVEDLVNLITSSN